MHAYLSSKLQADSKMNEATLSSEEQPVEFIPFNEFRNGLPFGRFRVIVNPNLAQKYMRQRLYIIAISIPMIAIGLGLAFSGFRWTGAFLVIAGVLLNRIVKMQASKILLHMATRDPAVYRDALEREIMEVQRTR